MKRLCFFLLLVLNILSSPVELIKLELINLQLQLKALKNLQEVNYSKVEEMMLKRDIEEKKLALLEAILKEKKKYIEINVNNRTLASLIKISKKKLNEYNKVLLMKEQLENIRSKDQIDKIKRKKEEEENTIFTYKNQIELNNIELNYINYEDFKEFSFNYLEKLTSIYEKIFNLIYQEIKILEIKGSKNIDIKIKNNQMKKYKKELIVKKQMYELYIKKLKNNFKELENNLKILKLKEESSYEKLEKLKKLGEDGIFSKAELLEKELDYLDQRKNIIETEGKMEVIKEELKEYTKKRVLDEPS